MATLHGHPRWSFHLCTLAQGFLHCRGAKGGKWSQEDRAVISECHSRTRLLSGSMTRGSRQGHWSRDQQPKGKLSPCGCREAAQVSREDLDVKGFLSTSRQLFKFMGVWGLLVLVLVWLSLSHPAFLSMIQRPTGLISWSGFLIRKAVELRGGPLKPQLSLPGMSTFYSGVQVHVRVPLLLVCASLKTADRMAQIFGSLTTQRQAWLHFQNPGFSLIWPSKLWAFREYW